MPITQVQQISYKVHPRERKRTNWEDSDLDQERRAPVEQLREEAESAEAVGAWRAEPHINKRNEDFWEQAGGDHELGLHIHQVGQI